MVDYSTMGFFGLAAVTQLLAIFGIMPWLNMAVWFYLGGLYSLVLVLSDIYFMYIYEVTTNISAGATASAPFAQALLPLLEDQAEKEAIRQLGTGLALAEERRNWLYAYWLSLDTEQKQKWIEGAAENDIASIKGLQTLFFDF